MSLWEALVSEGSSARTLWVSLLVAVTTLLMRTVGKSRAPRLRALYFLFVVHLVCLVVSVVQKVLASALYLEFRVPALVAGGIVIVGCTATLLFNLVLPRMHLEAPRIVQDVIVAIAAVIAGVGVASRAGVNLSGLIATSAVFTAVLGFSLQDVIGNVAGGLALQIDNSLELGDWVRFGDIEGRVTEIRWRYTALETRNWDTVLVPNSQLMKSSVSVIGRRGGQAAPVAPLGIFQRRLAPPTL